MQIELAEHIMERLLSLEGMASTTIMAPCTSSTSLKGRRR